jgi:hypothetical protein
MSGEAISSTAFMESNFVVESRAEVFTKQNIFAGTGGENGACAEKESVSKDGNDLLDVMSNKYQGWGVAV